MTPESVLLAAMRRIAEGCEEPRLVARQALLDYASARESEMVQNIGAPTQYIGKGVVFRRY